MSFGPSQAQKNAQNQQNALTTTAVANSGNLSALGGANVNTGTGTVQSGVNFFNTLLGGNRANTTAMLAPNINQVTGDNAATIHAINTLMPRTGGRAASLFSQSFAPLNTITNLFNGGRVAGAQALPQIGLGQAGVGTNLFGLGNAALGQGQQGTQLAVQNEMQNRQMSNSLISGLAGGLFSLATTPFGGGSAKNGLLGLL